MLHTDPVQANESKDLELSGSSRSDLFYNLSQNIPLTDYHLPEYIYRADLIPQNFSNKEAYSYNDRQNILESAAVPITFRHGYPAVNDTSPFWERLPAETDDAYDVYLKYLELPEISKSENPIRLLPLIADLTNIDISRITEWCNVYYWHWRARAYDLFLVAMHRKQREQRIMTIEGRHYSMAERLLDKAASLANLKFDKELLAIQNSDGDEGDMSETKLKDLIDMMDKLVKVQRVSLGLSTGAANTTINNGPRYATVDDQFKDVAKEGATEQTSAKRSEEHDHLLDNPDDLASMQELLIRITHKEIRAIPHIHDHQVRVDESDSSYKKDFIDVTPES